MRIIVGIIAFKIACLISFVGMAQSPQIIYVKRGASGAANGSSWQDAYPELRTALTAAASITGSKEIWVAQGEYKPTSGIDRTLSFKLLPQTFLYGGFVGNETSKDARNWRLNRTVLSGDLGAQFIKTDNSYHVLVATDMGNASGADGFIITGASDTGAAVGTGGGVLIQSDLSLTSPKFSNCVFENNEVSAGAAIAVTQVNSQTVSAEFLNCEFKGNSASVIGGVAVVNAEAVAVNVVRFINCSFSSNKTALDAPVFTNAGITKFINCTFTYNKGKTIQNYGNIEVKNSILWNNFTGTIENPTYVSQIENSDGTVVVQDNIIQGGYGTSSDNNVDTDPLFKRQPSFVGTFPRTSIIPVTSTNPKYENQLEFVGDALWGPWPYYTFKDHTYNKIYLAGRNLQILDFNNLVDNKPTSVVYTDVYFPRTQRPDRSIHNASNSIYLATGYTGLIAVNRSTGQRTTYNMAVGESGSFTSLVPNDLIIDNTNNLLYTPVFTEPGLAFYGLLELNLTTQAKRWITTTSTPVSVQGGVVNVNDESYWGGMRIFLDDQSNTFYMSTGNGVWWWNRTTNATGLYSTTGGIPVQAGNALLPSNKATGIYMDTQDNKLYIGTHEGLFVWDKTNNTSRVYNTSNSKLIHNVINTIDKNEEKHLIYVACEDGALFIIDTVTGEERLITRDAGSDTYPQYMDVSAASAFYDEVDKKLYVSADHTTGGTWIMDYGNLVPDYGDLQLKSGSPAVDRGNQSFLPSEITTDLAGAPRLVDYVNIQGTNSLDLGAYELPLNDGSTAPDPIPTTLGLNYILTYLPQKESVKELSQLDNYIIADVNRSIQYFDGLGRPLQSILIQGSPSFADLITPVEYDQFGRVVKKYLPYIGGSNGLYDAAGVSNSIEFYNTPVDPTITSDTRPFSETVFEPSPLNRPVKDYGPGQAWGPTNGADRFVEHNYISNVHNVNGDTEQEAIILWVVVSDSDANDPSAQHFENSGYYGSGQLSIKVTVDENHNTVREYTNKQGQVVLKKVQAVSSPVNLNDPEQWACTYYIYDDLDNLSFVLQPEGLKQYLAISQP